MRPLIILRPEPGASATAKAAEELGLAPLVMPLFRLEPVTWQAPDPGQFDALLLTSANAVRLGGYGLDAVRTLPAYCVGERTASAAREAGVEIAGVGKGGVDALLELLPPDLNLLHLTGAHWHEPARAVQSIKRVPVYRSIELPCPERFADAKGAVAALHSPRAAYVFARHVDDAAIDRGTIAIAAISPAAAEAGGAGWETIEAACEPSDAALLAIAARLCKKRG